MTEVGGMVRERVEYIMLLALNMEKRSQSQEIQVEAGRGKEFSPRYFRRYVAQPMP